jgi:hypothetical protein
MGFILAKTSRCYYGGQGRRDVIYPTIKEAAQGAVDDGNPVGFDVYRHLERAIDWDEPGGSECQQPVMTWAAIREFMGV